MQKVLFTLLFFVPLLAQSQPADSLQRQVKLQGGGNFRDIGGYATSSGKHVKWGKMYRSGAIDKLTHYRWK